MEKPTWDISTNGTTRFKVCLMVPYFSHWNYQHSIPWECEQYHVSPRSDMSGGRSLAHELSCLVKGSPPSTETAAKVPCCPVNVVLFQTRSSAKAVPLKRNVAKSNCIMASRGRLWSFLWVKDAIKHHLYFSKCHAGDVFTVQFEWCILLKIQWLCGRCGIS